MKRIMVTGGAGFVGEYVCRELVKKNYDVFVVDDLSNGEFNRIPIQADFLQKDILTIQKSDIPTCDVIIHLAARISASDSIKQIEKTHQINVNGTLRILELAKQLNRQKIVFASSAAVYGSTPIPHIESGPLEFLSPYALHKYVGEKYLEQYAKHFGLQSIALRFFNIYGKGQKASSPYAGVISVFKERCKQNQPFIIHGDGTKTRDFIHVSDVAEAIIKSVEIDLKGFEVFNVGTGKQTSILELARLIGGKEYPILFEQERSGDPCYSQADISRIRTVLGFQPKQISKELLNEI